LSSSYKRCFLEDSHDAELAPRAPRDCDHGRYRFFLIVAAQSNEREHIQYKHTLRHDVIKKKWRGHLTFARPHVGDAGSTKLAPPLWDQRRRRRRRRRPELRRRRWWRPRLHPMQRQRPAAAPQLRPPPPPLKLWPSPSPSPRWSPCPAGRRKAAASPTRATSSSNRSVAVQVDPFESNILTRTLQRCKG
jgi:hypothetical protein